MMKPKLLREIIARNVGYAYADHVAQLLELAEQHKREDRAAEIIELCNQMGCKCNLSEHVELLFPNGKCQLIS